MGVSVTASQEATISKQAADHLRNTPRISIPGPHLTQQVADQINADIAAAASAVLASTAANFGLTVQRTTLGGIPTVKITPPKVTRHVKRRGVVGFFVHGGGFALASADDYNAYRMASDIGVIVYSVDYSLSPRVHFPTPVNETRAAYRALRRRHRRVLVAGSSAGANLLITTILKAPRRRRPAAAGLFSPNVDLRRIGPTSPGDSYIANEGRDPLLTQDLIRKLHDAYLAGAAPTDPEASPILASYGRDFTPTIITTGTRDQVQSDGVRLYWKLRDAHAPVELRVWEGMWHAFENNADVPKESDEAMREVFGFLKKYV